MHLFAALFLLLQAPFWESKPPKEWINREVDYLLTQSAWVALAESPNPQRGDPEVKVYLASAKPIAEAEAERRSRSKAGTDPVAEEYRIWSAENRGKYVVLAIPVNDQQAMAMAEEGRGVEKSVMVLGKKKVPLAMHFPPSSTDPYLRLVFPKLAAEKKLRFEIFVPGAIAPEREVEFDVSKLKYLGKPEY